MSQMCQTRTLRPLMRTGAVDHLVGNNGQALSEKAVARSCSVSVEQLRRLRTELDEVGVPGRTGDRDYDPIFHGDINGDEIDLSPLRIETAGVLYSRRLIKDQRLRVIRRLSLILGRPKSGRLTGLNTDLADQNAERDARGRAANDNDGSLGEQSPETGGEGSGGGRTLNSSQLVVKSVEDALQRHTTGFALPDPRRIAKEIQTFGIDVILAAIQREGDRSALDHRNWNYLHQILESDKRRPRGVTAGTGGGNGTDRRTTPTKTPGGKTAPRTAADFGNEDWRAVLARTKQDVPAVPDDSSGGSNGDLH